MTVPSQFSLEEENFYKDIQDLLKNSSQNEKELSLFLQRYMDLLSKADLDDESFIINFTKAGLIIEASAKLYGTKVDRLWNNLEHVLLSLRSKGHGQSKQKVMGVEEVEMEADESRRRLSVNSKRRKKVGDALVSADDFTEIDNITGLLGKSMNEIANKSPGNLKFCEKIPNMFIKNKQKKKKIDVCLNKNVEEKDMVRLNDWVISAECLLVKEMFTLVNDKLNESDVSDSSALNKSSDEIERLGINIADASKLESMNSSALRKDLEDKNSDVQPEKTIEEPNCISADKDSNNFPKDNSCVENDLNISRESDLAKFPNVLGRVSKACLVDIDEVFWNREKFEDLIPSKKLKTGKGHKTFNPPCKLCKKKEAHQGKKAGKRCKNKKRRNSGLDSYFIPHVQPTIGEPHFGLLPDQELISTFKQENKLIEQLAKVNAAKNVNEAFHPHENAEELKNFLGFDGFEKNLIRINECNEDELEVDFEDDNPDEEPNLPDNPPVEDFELPVPVTENSVTHKVTNRDCNPRPKDDDMVAESEYQKLVQEGLKDHYEAKSIFAKNKELAIKISRWHEMISDKIKLSEIRGAMNMKVIANKIMKTFPSPPRGDLPQMSFRELVKEECRRDVPRYFFGCLQLTNEGNVSIRRTDPRPLATDCMVVVQLRPTRRKCDLDESTARSPIKEAKTPEKNKTQKALKRSPLAIENKSPTKTKRVKKRTEKAHKRQKNFTALNNSKKISSEHKNAVSTEFEKCEIATTLNEDNQKDKNPKRPKKSSTLPSDYFQEIETFVRFSDETINEKPETEKIKFYDDVFKVFLKIKTRKKKCVGNENSFRLRDWIVTKNCLLVKEIGTSIQEHKLYETNKKPEKKPAPTNERVLISSVIQNPKSKTNAVHSENATRETVVIRCQNFIGTRRIITAGNDYLKKFYTNRQPEEAAPQEENPPRADFNSRDNDQGPSNMSRIRRALKAACEEWQDFAILSIPKQIKFQDCSEKY